MAYKTWQEAWQEVRRRGYMTHTYEWSEAKQGWIVRRMTKEEIRRMQRARTALQKAHDDSLSVDYRKIFR